MSTVVTRQQVRNVILSVSANVAMRDRTLAEANRLNPTEDARAHFLNHRHMVGIHPNAHPVTPEHPAWKALTPDSRRSYFPLMREGRLYA